MSGRDEPVLVLKPLGQILTFWRPGSGDWSWSEEYADMWGHHRHVTEAILKRVEADGIGFADHITPVLLGSDGRVWDGHHRICIAIKQGIPSLMCEVAGDEWGWIEGQ